MATRQSDRLTILILREGGRSPVRLAIPKWFVSLFHSCALTLLGLVGFLGWQLHGLYGLQGQQLLSLGLEVVTEHWSLFERLAP